MIDDRPPPATDAASPARSLASSRRSGRATPNLVIDRGEGSWLITRDGERYLDYTSGIGVTNTGHAHPRVAAAVAAQAQKLLHGQQNIVYHEPGLRLHDRLRRACAGRPVAAFLSNSGAEAIEAVRQAGTRRDRAAGDRRVPRRLPRPHRPDDGADDRQGVVSAATSSRCRGPSITRPTRTATGRRAAPTIRPPAPATGRRSST